MMISVHYNAKMKTALAYNVCTIPAFSSCNMLLQYLRPTHFLEVPSAVQDGNE